MAKTRAQISRDCRINKKRKEREAYSLAQQLQELSIMSFDEPCDHKTVAQKTKLLLPLALKQRNEIRDLKLKLQRIKLELARVTVTQAPTGQG